MGSETRGKRRLGKTQLNNTFKDIALRGQSSKLKMVCWLCFQTSSKPSTKMCSLTLAKPPPKSNHLNFWNVLRRIEGRGAAGMPQSEAAVRGSFPLCNKLLVAQSITPALDLTSAMQGHESNHYPFPYSHKNYLIFSHCPVTGKRIGCYGGSSTDYHRLANWRTSCAAHLVMKLFQPQALSGRYPLHARKYGGLILSHRPMATFR